MSYIRDNEEWDEKAASDALAGFGRPQPEPKAKPKPERKWSDPRDSEDFDDTLRLMLVELGCAIAKFPDWPSDPIHALGIVAEELGETQKEVNQFVYEYDEKGDWLKLRTEAAQTAASAFRFLMSIKRYHSMPSTQHKQI